MIAIAAAAAVAGILASPPGRSVIRSIREAVGVENAQHELFSLPAPGRLLVDSARGPWTVDADGSRRLLGSYREASWSPFGRFVAAARASELVALDPKGGVRWTLARPDVRSPAWGGLRDDTRIAYVARDGLHVVAGDGTGDRLLGTGERGPFAWRPGLLAQLASVGAGEVRLEDTDAGRVLWRSRLGSRDPVRTLAWSADGTRLLIASAHGLRVLDARGKLVSRAPSPLLDATFVGTGHDIATLDAHGDVRVGRRLVFHAPGLRQVVTSPDSHLLLLTWPAADQWVFVQVDAPHAIRAVSGIARQFGGGAFPLVAGWIGK